MPNLDTAPDPFSLATLRIQAHAMGRGVGTATSFVVASGEDHWLISNWHVFSGRDSDTERKPEDAPIPEGLTVSFHADSSPWGVEKAIDLRLYDDYGAALWLEHPNRRASARPIDLAALRLPALPAQGAHLYSLDLALAATGMYVPPGEVVHVIGFPFGLSTGILPLWKTGHLATGAETNGASQPFRLVDVSGRSGMSGSPVLARRHGVTVKPDGEVDVFLGKEELFVGVYSGRLVGDRARPREEPYSSEIGIVWKPHLVVEMLAGGVPGPAHGA